MSSSNLVPQKLMSVSSRSQFRLTLWLAPVRDEFNAVDLVGRKLLVALRESRLIQPTPVTIAKVLFLKSGRVLP